MSRFSASRTSSTSRPTSDSSRMPVLSKRSRIIASRAPWAPVAARSSRWHSSAVSTSRTRSLPRRYLRIRAGLVGMRPASFRNPKNALTDILILSIEPGLRGDPSSWCVAALEAANSQSVVGVSIPTSSDFPFRSSHPLSILRSRRYDLTVWRERWLALSWISKAATASAKCMAPPFSDTHRSEGRRSQGKAGVGNDAARSGNADDDAHRTVTLHPRVP